MSGFTEISLLSERLTLKRICPELHVVEINAAVTDSFDSLVRWLPWSIKPPTVEETLKNLIRVAEDPHYAFRIYLNQSQQLIGQCGLKLINESGSFKKTFEIGYFLLKNFTGKGYMHEAVSCILDFGVKKLMAERFLICCDKNNIKSHNVALKCGFKFTKQIQLTFEARPDWGLCTDFVFEKDLYAVSHTSAGFEAKFQLSKYNKLWDSAVKLLSPMKLSQLELSLKKLDKEELALKHLKNEGKENKDLEFSIQKHLAEISQLYRLGEKLNDLKMEYEKTFSDDQLENIWNIVQFESELNENERQTLYKELIYIQDAISNYQKLLTKAEKSFQSDVKSPSYKDEAAKNSKRLTELQNRLKEENENIDIRIQQFTMNEASIVDKRVVELWNKAKLVEQFSNEDLKSIKNELRHLQTGIDKLNYWLNETENLRMRGEKEDYNHAKLKLEEYQRHVKKYHATMVNRISPKVEL